MIAELLDRLGWSRRLGPWAPMVVPVVLSLAAPLLVLLNATDWVRGPVLALFFLVAPGEVIAHPLRLRGPTRLVVVPVLSLAALTAVSLVDIYLLTWSVPVSVALLAALTVVGAVFIVLRSPREVP